jgi:hypothetical protein
VTSLAASSILLLSQGGLLLLPRPLQHRLVVVPHSLFTHPFAPGARRIAVDVHDKVHVILSHRDWLKLCMSLPEVKQVYGNTRGDVVA